MDYEPLGNTDPAEARRRAVWSLAGVVVALAIGGAVFVLMQLRPGDTPDNCASQEWCISVAERVEQKSRAALAYTRACDFGSAKSCARAVALLEAERSRLGALGCHLGDAALCAKTNP